MSYDDQLRQHREAVARQQAAAAAAETRRRIALEEACREGEEIIRERIAPELVALKAALDRAEHPARVTTRREVAPHTPDAAFDVEVELLEDILDGRAKRGIRYTAFPAGKYFLVVVKTSTNPQTEPRRFQIRFDQTGSAEVQEVCADFLSRAFPAQ